MNLLVVIIVMSSSLTTACPYLKKEKGSSKLGTLETLLAKTPDGSDFLPKMHDKFQDRSLPTMVHHVISNELTEAEDLLMESPETRLTPDNSGYTPLQWACVLGRENFARFLLDTSVDPNEPSNYPALHLAVMQNNLDTVKLLLEKGADVNLMSKRGLTPLAHAVDENYVDLVKILLKRGADPNTREHHSALHIPVLAIAAMRGDDNIVKELLEAKADRWSLTKRGQNALMFACAGWHLDTVRLLLDDNDVELAKNIDAKDAMTFSALPYAIQGPPKGKPPTRSAGRPDVKGYPKTELKQDSEDSMFSIVELLLKHGASVSVQVEAGRRRGSKTSKPLVRFAVDKDHLDIFILLLKKGAPVDSDKFDYVLWASKHNSTRAVQLLLERTHASEETENSGEHSEENSEYKCQAEGASKSTGSMEAVSVVVEHQNWKLLDKLLCAGYTTESLSAEHKALLAARPTAGETD